MGFFAGVRGAERCSAGSCTPAGLAEEGRAAEDRSGVHLLQAGAVKMHARNQWVQPSVPTEAMTYCWDDMETFTWDQEGVIFLLHIPKAAGCSLKRDLIPIVGSGKICSQEFCYSNRDVFENISLGFRGVMTALRNPRSHVLSQYFECSSGEDWHPTRLSELPKHFDDYVAAWARWQEQGNASGLWLHSPDLPLTCYRPVNLQATRYACSMVFEYPQFINITQAVHNMMMTEYVGIVEAYQETICLFHAKLTGILPSYCDCADVEAWGSFKSTEEDHGTLHHSLSDYSEAVVADVDSITFADRVLYRAAVKRFLGEVQEVEKHFGTKILCTDLVNDPSLRYVLAPLAD